MPHLFAEQTTCSTEASPDHPPGTRQPLSRHAHQCSNRRRSPVGSGKSCVDIESRARAMAPWMTWTPFACLLPSSSAIWKMPSPTPYPRKIRGLGPARSRRDWIGCVSGCKACHANSERPIRRSTDLPIDGSEQMTIEKRSILASARGTEAHICNALHFCNGSPF